ncbi:MAG: glycosyltransferase family 4 protein [Thiobacillaceae bacterium]
MRIGIDLVGYDPDYSGGVATFSMGIAKGLINSIRIPDRIVIIVSDRNESALRFVFDGLPVSFLRISVTSWYRYANGVLGVLAWASRNFRLRGWYERWFRSDLMNQVDDSVDVLVAPMTKLNFYALKVPSILCIHDIQHEYYPEFFSVKERMSRWVSYRLSCWKAAAIQASSEYIKACLVEKFLFLKPEKIFVAYEGVDLEKFSSSAPCERPSNLEDLAKGDFVFYPAQIWAHKNHLLLLEALAIFRTKHGEELPCVLTGQDAGYWAVVQTRIRELDLKRVYYLGRVSFGQVLWLYQNCRAVLALGLHESSSLPAREGAVFGKPLLCSNIPPNIEAQGHLYLEIVDSENPLDLADTFDRLLEDRDGINERSQENIERVRVFDWNSIAARYVSVCRELTASGHSTNSSIGGNPDFQK